jgi:hypothetical protein
MNKAVCSITITIAHHHHENYAAGTGHQSAFIAIIITRQQDLAKRLSNFTQHHITTFALEKMKLGHRDQAIRLSNTLPTPAILLTIWYNRGGGGAQKRLARIDKARRVA